MHKHLESLLIPNRDQQNRFVRIKRLEQAAAKTVPRKGSLMSHSKIPW